MEKYQGFWPLPGGIENYVDTLQRALSFMRDSRPSEEELAKWFVTNFQKVHVGSARGYIRVALRHSGLVDYDKKKHLLSKAGEDYLAKTGQLPALQGSRCKCSGVQRNLRNHL